MKWRIVVISSVTLQLAMGMCFVFCFFDGLIYMISVLSASAGAAPSPRGVHQFLLRAAFKVTLMSSYAFYHNRVLNDFPNLAKDDNRVDNFEAGRATTPCDHTGAVFNTSE